MVSAIERFYSILLVNTKLLLMEGIHANNVHNLKIIIINANFRINRNIARDPKEVWRCSWEKFTKITMHPETPNKNSKVTQP